MRFVAWLLLSALACGADSPRDDPLAKLPKSDVEHLGSVRLDIPLPPAPSAIRDVFQFDMDDHGRIGFLRFDKGNIVTFVLIKKTGDQVFQTAPPASGKEWGLPILRWLGVDRWAIFWKSGDAKKAPRIAVVDARKMRFEMLDSANYPDFRSVAGDRMGGFILTRSLLTPLGGIVFHFDAAEIIAYGPDGKERWRNTARNGDLEGPARDYLDIAVTTDGRVVLRDQCDQDLFILDEKGKNITAIDAHIAPHCIPIENEVHAAIAGNIIISDPVGHGPIRHVPIKQLCKQESLKQWKSESRSGDFASFSREPEYADGDYTPHFADGRRVAFRDGARVDSDGHIWITDGTSFLRLRDDGVVDLVLGDAAEDEDLRSIRDGKIDANGSVLMLNERSGSVHIFDPIGKQTRIFKPEPKDFVLGRSSCEMAVDADGNVLVWNWDSRYLRFASGGERLGFDSLGLKWASGRLLFQPTGGGIWIVSNIKVQLADRKGKHLATIETRPDGRPLASVDCAAVGPDGSVAVIADTMKKENPDRHTLNLYSSEGKPVKMLPMPDCGRAAWAAFDGRFVVVGAWYGRRLLVVDTKTGISGRIDPPGADSEPTDWVSWHPFFVHGGKELWLLHPATRTIERYDAPAAE